VSWISFKNCIGSSTPYAILILAQRSSEFTSSALKRGRIKLNHNLTRWCRLHRPFLGNHRSPLEFNLHRSRYIRLLLLLSKDEGAGAALNYARRHFPPLYAANSEAILRLISALAFLPASRLASSPYSDLTSPSIHAELETQFEREYCNLLKMSRQLPLRVVGDLGGSGALSKIERGKRVILDKKTEWSASDELPVRADR
jgi:hypothetical protein